LLDIEKIENSRIALAREQIDLTEIVKNVCDTFRLLVSEKGLSLIVDLEPGIKMVGDKDRLSQIVSNLISNAVKYTKKGHVSISLSIKDELITFSVADTGIGMTSEQEDKLFQRFFRADNDYVKEVGGTGLGLSITKALVQHHQGEIIVTSEKDKGSVFTVHFPAPKSDIRSIQISKIDRKEDSARTPKTVKSQGEILIVDDDEDFTKILKIMISREGYTAEACHNKKELLNWIIHTEFRLIILDVFLPDANGIDLFKILSKDYQYQRPVILLSAKAIDQQVSDQAKALGVRAYVSKGSGISHIMSVIRRELDTGENNDQENSYR